MICGILIVIGQESNIYLRISSMTLVIHEVLRGFPEIGEISLFVYDNIVWWRV